MMTDAADPFDRPFADVDATPDWDLFVGPADDIDVAAWSDGGARLAFAHSTGTEMASGDDAGPGDVELAAVDDPSECYQAHFLDVEEPEAECVAHVHLPDAPPQEAPEVAIESSALGQSVVDGVVDHGRAELESGSPGGDADSDGAELEATQYQPGGEPEIGADFDDEQPDIGYGTIDGSEVNDVVLLPAVAGGGWTIPLLCLGLAIIAFCMVVPQADINRRLTHERTALRADLESIQTQVATNDEFLRRLASDPALAERLAQRQLGLQRAGTRSLPIRLGNGSTSPFDLVQVAPPKPMEPYEPLGGKVAAACRDSRSRLYLMGAGLFLLAAGLILGVAPPGPSDPSLL